MDDVSQALLYLLGGTGLVSYFLTWWQFHEIKKVRARRYFNNLVMTENFRHFLGQLVKLHSTLRNVKTPKDLLDYAMILAEQTRAIQKMLGKLSDEGTFFFIPENIETRLVKVSETLAAVTNNAVKGEETDTEASAKELAMLALDLKKALGIGELE